MDYKLISSSPFFLPARDICHGAEYVGTAGDPCAVVSVPGSSEWCRHCHGERMSLWKRGNKEFYPNLNSCHIFQGTIYQLAMYTAEWVQFSNERPGSKVGLECRVVQDEKWNVNDWCGYQWNTFFQCKNVLPVFSVSFLLEFPECIYIDM